MGHERKKMLSRADAPSLTGWAGGASRDRTDDLKLAKLALSQLSYGPDPVTPRSKLAHPGYPTT